IDRFTLNLDANETEEQRFLLGNIPVNSQWNYTTGISYKRYAENGFWTFVLSRNMLNNEAEKFENNDESQALILDYKSQETENKLRIENTTRKGNYKFNFGVAYEFVQYNSNTFNLLAVPGGQQEINFFSEIDFHKYAAFAQVSRDWLQERLVTSVGLRLDGASYSSEMSNPLEQFSPRVSVAYNLSQKWIVNANAGLYYQLPPFTVMGYEEDGVLVNKLNGVDYIQNYQLVAGLEYNSGSNSKITLEGYYKRYNNYPFTVRDSIALANLGGDFGVLGNEPVVSTARGRTYGIELLLQQRLYKGFYGLVSYTLGWSEFEDKNGEFVPSSWDSRHIVNMTAGKRFPKNWELGVNFRVQSALPFTPFDEERSAVIQNWDITNEGLRDFNQLNQGRFQPNHTLDIRIDKKWFYDKWSFQLYLDIENIYGNTVNDPQLVLDLDEEGNRQIDPNQLDSYLLKTLEVTQGTVLPSIGVVIIY
ncbi:MAG: TonB-dependent receptor, partial [Bacteroidota bacterium]